LPDGVYEVEVQTPSKQVRRVNAARSGSEDRGVFKPDEAGEYVIKVKGKAKDPEGTEISGTAEARFLVHEEDVEMAEWSADKTLMDKLAKEGRGRAVTAAKLPDLLRDLLAPAAQDGKTKLVSWPNWKSDPKKEGRSSFLVVFFLMFVACLTGEWLLRRRWGMA
jgi:hypothetical protein